MMFKGKWIIKKDKIYLDEVVQPGLVEILPVS